MRITNNYTKPFPKNSIQNRPNTSTNTIKAGDYTEKSPAAKIDYSQIAFGAIYNVKNKKIDLAGEKNKLLRQLRELLSSYCKDTDPTDLFFGAIEKALRTFKTRLEKEVNILQGIEDTMADASLSSQQKMKKVFALKKEHDALGKQKITPKKPVIPQEDERIDYILLNKFKTSLEDGNFNLRRVWMEHYGQLQDITSIEELNKAFPKIKTPKRPEEVIASKIISTLTKDFYEELDYHMTANNNEGIVKVIENKISEVSVAVANKYNINPFIFAQKIVKAATEGMIKSYDTLKERGMIASLPAARKSNIPAVSELDIKLLSIDFDDFVLSSIRKHYLEGQKINQIIYTNGNTKINLSSLRGSEYKFEKTSEKVKTIVKDSDALFKAQRDYPHYDIDEFRTRLNHYAGTEIGNNEIIFNKIIDFDTCNFTDEDINNLTKFLRELDDVSDGKTTLEEGSKKIITENYSPKGTEKQNELEKRKTEELLKAERKNSLKLKAAKNEFNDIINQLYSNNLNNIALTCSKYEPQSLDPAELERAKYLVRFITNSISTDGTPINKYKLETGIHRWDAYTTYEQTNPKDPVFQQALQYARQKDGSIDIDKAGQYIINSEITATYPECSSIVENPEIVSKIMERGKSNAVEYLCKLDKYKELISENNNSILKITEIFDPKNPTDKAILKHIIENDYITSDTFALLEISEGGKPIKAAIAAKAKQQIINKYKYPQCLDYFTAFENALTNFAGEKGTSGIKNTGRNNKAIQHRMELKIKGEDDRLLSSKNDYYFDIFSDKGMH